MPLSHDWAKSSHSTSNGGDCVQARHAGHAVQVRDSKNPDGPVLAFTKVQWLALAAEIKNGQHRIT